MRLPHRLVSWLGMLAVLAVPPFLVLTNVNVFMTPAFISYEYGKSDFPISPRFDPSDRARYAIETIRYTRGELNDTDLKNLGVYNERELAHMRDVQNLAVPALILDYVLGAILFLNALLLWRTGQGVVFLRAMVNGGVLTLIIFGAIGLVALLAFNTFFVTFHRLFFVGDSWLFAYTDSLIQFYPQPLWVDASLGIVLFAVLQAVLLAVVCWKALGRSANAQRKRVSASRELRRSRV